MHRLRRSVAVEVVIAAVILSITALLVNAAPARSVETQPVSLTLKSGQVWVYVDIAPGIAGPNDMHFTVVADRRRPRDHRRHDRAVDATG